MHIYVNNKLAALKKGTSFEFVSDNRLFSGSDGYSLTITFPLRGCPVNQRDGSFGLLLAYVWCAYGMQTKSYYVCSGNVVWGWRWR